MNETTLADETSSRRGEDCPSMPCLESQPLRVGPPHRTTRHVRQLADWAVSLERKGLCRLSTFHGVNNRWIVLPWLRSDNAGLVSIWNDGGAYLQFWRSVLERRAPNTLPHIESLIAPAEVRQGNSYRDISDDLLDALTQAYREANGQ